MRFWLPIFLSLFLFLPSKVTASEKFQVSHEVTYAVQESGNTKVTQNVHIKNLSTESLAKEFVFRIKNYRISNIRAYDTSGALTVDAYQIPGGVEARVQFGKLTPGLDKIHHWTLSFETPSLTKKIGRLWKVSMPPIAKTAKTNEVLVTLHVPESFGPMVLAKPAPTESSNVWTGKNADGQIIAVFGGQNKDAYQAYNFNLKYYLENKDPWPKTQTIALPPDTAYQKVFLTKINPKPNSIKTDIDGNWMAKYNLQGKQTISITASGDIAVFGNPKQTLTSNFDPSLYLKSQPFWEVGHKDVVEVAKLLKTPEDIYNSTVKNLSYDKKKSVKNGVRMGAIKALNSPLTAICTEFTDVFVTLARTLQIPAREIDGFAYTEDQQFFPSALGTDVLHAWPEYYDNKSASWRMVDPTWGKTSGGLDYFHSFDFDHVALAIKGIDSQNPIPAGFYKKTNKLKKFIKEEKPRRDVFIIPVDKDLDLDNKPILKVTKRARLIFFGLVKSGSELVVSNNSTQASEAQEITANGKQITVPTIPPLGEHVILLDN